MGQSPWETQPGDPSVAAPAWVGSEKADPLDRLAAQSAEKQAQAQPHKSSDVLVRRPLIAYLDDFANRVERAVAYFRGASEQELATSYSAEWILDNAHIAFQALREVRRGLPLYYYRQLPHLAAGQLAGYPRVYGLAREFLVFERLHYDPQRLRRFLNTYQSITLLTIGETWALPQMLRLVTAQCLARSASRLTHQPVELGDGYLPLVNFEETLGDDEIVANSFQSLRALAAENWMDFFEDVSPVESILRRDPAGLYAGMDFETRDIYRKAVAQVARGSYKTEWDTAAEAVRLAQQAIDRLDHPSPVVNGEQAESPADTPFPAPQYWDQFKQPRAAHVGYYLKDQGLSELEASMGFQTTGVESMRRWIFTHPTLVYMGSILSLSGLVVLLAVMLMRGQAWYFTLLGGLLSIVPALTLSVELANWVITHSASPHVLPKMDFRDEIPPECTTLVVIPALLSSAEEVQSLLQQLELHMLRNFYPQLYFALLTDFSDAAEEQTPADSEILAAAVQGLQSLNDKYRNLNRQPFMLLNRSRRFNPSEGVWMGWERKRGKLAELNRLILEQGETTFSTQEGGTSILSSVRYVITLDADTILPRESAPRLIGTLAHPLNRPEFDPRTHKVTRGYGVLQPRVEISPTSSNLSLFTRIFAGEPGLDLYTLAVSDVYQDLFGEGIYVGKGIYDVRAFAHSLVGRVPENTLLSHDLFEGLFAHAGLATDIVLIEDFPPSYLAHIRRLERWVRGDWQLLPWLGSKTPTRDKGRQATQLSLIDRWKIIDNLRRSLVAPGIVVLLLVGWLWLPGPLWWTLFAVGSMAVPWLIDGLASVLSIFIGVPIKTAFTSVVDGISRWLLDLIFLPYEALLTLNAIGITIVRLWFTRRKRLQWTTAADAGRAYGKLNNAGLTVQQMFVALLFAAAVGISVAAFRPQALLPAAPLLLGWLLSPEIAYWISRPFQAKQVDLSEGDLRSLHRLARRTWLFFEQFMGPEDHWLPPDNFQEAPLGVAAHRTSPTNIGLALVSTLGAHDLGYLGLLELVGRLRATFDSLEQLERYNGHFLNWYDTRSLEPLLPSYVSTVDSGNLAASLIVLSQSLSSLPCQPILGWEIWQGFLDDLSLLEDLTDELQLGQAVPTALELNKYLAGVREAIEARRQAPETWAQMIIQATSAEPAPEGVFHRSELDQWLLALVQNVPAPLDANSLQRLRLYNSRLHQHLDSARREVETFLPWLAWIDEAGDFLDSPEMPAQSVKDWQSLKFSLHCSLSLQDLSALYPVWLGQIEQLRGSLAAAQAGQDKVQAFCERVENEIQSASMAAKTLQIAFEDFSRRCIEFVDEMDFRFLYNTHRQVFHIGYNVTTGRLDDNFYDLLASEARIASLIAIAKGDVPQSHWLHMARPVTRVDGRPVLLSWSATMFEYLMPKLFVKTYEGTLLNQTDSGVVQRQIEYGLDKNVPWGISESGFYRFDAALYYQYRAFGVPGLGYKRGLEEDLVITPYASLLALPVQPAEVMKNIQRMVGLGMMGLYGLYEAVDFTASRLALGENYQIVRSYMAHHQAMIFLSLVNHFTGEEMVNRFHADPRIQSAELLLQEQIPVNPPMEHPSEGQSQAVLAAQPKVTTHPWPVRLFAIWPQSHYLSNGHYSMLITSAGTGYSRWKEFDLTRWRADTTLNEWGTYIYIKDIDSGEVWSASYQPTGKPPEIREVRFNAHMASFTRRDYDISLGMDITIHPQDDLEVRRISLTNHGDRPRRLSLVSYAEVIMAQQAADQRHPAFNKLFIESEYHADLNLLMFRRRQRSDEEKPVWMGHTIVSEPGLDQDVSFESDRARFLGRGRQPRSPEALKAGQAGRPNLSQTSGSTLDPILSMEQLVELGPHQSVQLAFLSLAAGSQDEILQLASRYRAWHTVGRTFDEARSHAELELRQLGLNTQKLEIIQRVFSALMFPNYGLRADPNILAAVQKGQQALWGFGISGDNPILLVEVNDMDNLGLIHTLLQAHAYWRKRDIKIDLVILNTKGTDYGGELHSRIMRLIHRRDADAWLNARGGIFLLTIDRMAEADLALLRSAARVVLTAEKGSLAEQMGSLPRLPNRLPPFVSRGVAPEEIEPTQPIERPEGLLFDNGLGGFTPDGREYQIYLPPGSSTPAPWINVIANEDFGFLVTEAGGGYTWAANSGENRLTPWSNDPVSDTPGEVIYLRDEETSEVWSVTPLPAGASEPYKVRHGAGYTIFEHNSHGLNQRLHLFAAAKDPVKILRLRVENTWKRSRRITATFFVEWVLGVNREASQQYVIVDYDAESQAILARNPYQAEFAERIAFAAANKPLHGLTGSRTEFLGRMGSRAKPAALGRVGLSGTVTAGRDPCAALQLHIDLLPGQSEEIYFLLGQAENRDQAIQIVKAYQDLDHMERAWEEVQVHWESLLDAVQVHTPDPAMDLILNRWLLYQAIACRIWGRSAFYQSSGAYGFRDQLQDVMAVLYAAPELAREHLLRAARYQFEAGDVLHWWHPPSGRGVRTRFSDDLLWLPFVTAHYVAVTGDVGILDEEIPFLRGNPLEPGQEESYGLYPSNEDTCSLYEHCRRAIDKGRTAGTHGLPLMGTGDWNDGMNRVGNEGRGESVWLAWFLYACQMGFADICERRGEKDLAAFYRSQSQDLAKAVETSAWDGEWYKRAYYDDGTPLGSAQNRECQIDSIAQSWGVLSGAAEPERARQAMHSVSQRLVRPEDRLVLLFTPPFDKTPKDPGYIKGYLPGIRENGGQYTHASTWVAWAFTMLGQGDYAGELFQMLNPVTLADDPVKVARYKVEPYVVAADIYSVPPHTGRGGWTWYTGSSGWLYRLGLEAILGLRRDGGHFWLDPCIPKQWTGFEMTLRNGETTFQVQVQNPNGVSRGVQELTFDGAVLTNPHVPWMSDGKQHQVVVKLG